MLHITSFMQVNIDFNYFLIDLLTSQEAKSKENFILKFNSQYFLHKIFQKVTTLNSEKICHNGILAILEFLIQT
jgi:hypothetical protein